MNDARNPGPSERLVGWVLRTQPARLRTSYAEEMREMLVDGWNHEARGRSWTARTLFWTRMLFGGLKTRIGGGGSPDDPDTEGVQPDRSSNALRTGADDLRQAWRSVRRRPGYATVVALSFMVAIGINTAMFSVFNAVLLSPLPYPDSEELVRVYFGDEQAPGEWSYLPGAVFLGYRDGVTAFESLAALYTYSPTAVDITDGSVPIRVPSLSISANYFDVLGLRPVAGRTFRPEEELPETQVAIVSETIAEIVLGGPTSAIGRSITLDGRSRTVVGVMGPGARDPVVGEVDVWIPQNLTPGGENTFDNWYLTAYGRLADGVGLDAAQAQIDRETERFEEIDPATSTGLGFVTPLHDDLVGQSDTTLFLVMAAVGLVLLLASVNVSGMALALGARRERELAVRASLGAGRRRLGRQLLYESSILAGIGGLLGVAVAPIGLRGLVELAPAGLVGLEGVSLDARVLFFSLVATMLAGLTAGIAPSFFLGRSGGGHVLRSAASAGGGRRHASLRRLLVAAEVAVAVVLVIGAVLLSTSLERIRNVDLAMDPTDVITFEVALPTARYPTGEDRARFQAQYEELLRSMPGVVSVAAVSRLPATGSYHNWGARRLDLPPEERPRGATNQRIYEGDYFDALDITILQGRLPERGDPDGIVISRRTAEFHFPDEDPIGGRLQVGGPNWRIAAVVEDVPVTAYGDVLPKVYIPHQAFAGNRNWRLTHVLEVDAVDAAIFQGAMEHLGAIDPLLVFNNPGTLSDRIGVEIGSERFVAVLAGLFALVALSLAFVGIFGVVSESVAQRRREIGLRVALGAQTRTVLNRVLGEAATISAIGALAGAVAALFLNEWLQSLVYEVGVRDPVVFGVGAGALLLTALLAAVVPAVRAARVDPLEAFRTE